MTPGYGVIWDYQHNTTAKNDGWSVRFAEAADMWDPGIHPSLFAGLVAGRKIGPQGFGMIQVWGHCDTVFITNFPDVQLLSLHLAASTTAGVLITAVLYPLGGFVTDACTGFLGYYKAASVATYQLPIVVPVGGPYPWNTSSDTYGTVSGTITGSSSGTTKAFVRCF